MMRTWLFYDLSTGLFTGRKFSAPNDKQLTPNIKVGEGAIEAQTDPRSNRVDLETKQIVPYERPESSAQVIDAQTSILVLESKQGRALREATLGLPGAVERLQSIDDQIAQLRGTLQAMDTPLDGPSPLASSSASTALATRS